MFRLHIGNLNIFYADFVVVSSFILGIKRFNSIAATAAAAIGDPSKYWIICGACFVTLAGNKTSASVRIIGKPIM